VFYKFKEDIKIYAEAYPVGLLQTSFYILFTQQLYAIAFYRFGHWAECDCRIPIIGFFGRIIYFFLRKVSNILFGIDIRPNAKIGPGLKLEQFGGIFIEADIGKHCRIQQDVTIGHIGGFKGGGVPTIGDNVYIGAGAKVLGEVKIGNNVIIGANAVVIKDIPDNAIAVGIPAKVVKFRKATEPLPLDSKLHEAMASSEDSKEGDFS
jgi:serine O-acetyltransferase